MHEDPKALAVRYHTDIFQAQQLDVADKIIDVSFRVHGPGLAAETSLGPTGVKRLAKAMITGAPDLRITHDEVIGEGDKVLVRWTMTGTHEGELFGVPSSHRSFTITGLDLYRIEEGRIAELWQGWDQFGLLQQIGAILAPAPL